MLQIRIDGGRIHDFASFLDVFIEAFGFPDFFGRNMNAWIDCMTGLDDEFSKVQVAKGEMVCICLDNAGYFKQNCPEVYQAFMECSAFVNYRRIEVGRPPILAVSLYV